MQEFAGVVCLLGLLMPVSESDQCPHLKAPNVGGANRPVLAHPTSSADGRYYNNEDICWKITPEVSSHYVVMEIMYMDVEAGRPACNRDALVAYRPDTSYEADWWYSKSEIRRWCYREHEMRSLAPHMRGVSAFNGLLLRFTSDYSGRYKGFQLYYNMSSKPYIPPKTRVVYGGWPAWRIAVIVLVPLIVVVMVYKMKRRRELQTQLRARRRVMSVVPSVSQSVPEAPPGPRPPQPDTAPPSLYDPPTYTLAAADTASRADPPPSYESVVGDPAAGSSRTSNWDATKPPDYYP